VAEDKYSKARKARGLRKTILSPDDEPDTLKRAREEVRNARGIETIKTGGKIMAGCGGMRKKAMGGKIKMKAGGFPDLNKDGKVTQADILKGRGVGEDKKMKMGGKVKKGYHKMPDGTMMKDSEHKNMKKPAKKKMKSGGMVKRDGCAMRGKTKGRMV